MTRLETLSKITSKIAALDDERMAVLAELLQSWSEPLVYPNLPSAEKAKIEAALDRLDRGEGRPAEDVFAALQECLTAAGA